MKVKRMISNSVGALAQTMKVIVILDLEIISPGSQVGAKIGNPQHLGSDGKVTVITGNSLNKPCDGFGRLASQSQHNGNLTGQQLEVFEQVLCFF